MRASSILSMIFVIPLLIACSAPVTQKPETAEFPSNTPVQGSLRTPTQSPSSTATEANLSPTDNWAATLHAIYATQTLAVELERSTSTPRPGPTSPPTRTPSPTGGPVTDARAIVTPQFTYVPSDWEATPNFRSYTYYSESYLVSPDGRYVAHRILSVPEDMVANEFWYYGYFAIEDRGSRPIWVIRDGWEVMDYGPYDYSPYQWSEDSRYLYYRPQTNVDDCIPYAQGHWIDEIIGGHGLERVNIEAGIIETIIDGGTSAEISPDDTMVAYFQAYELVIRDMTTTTERIIPMVDDLYATYGWAGNIVWSPDQSAIMMVLVNSICADRGATLNIIRVDLFNSQIVTLSEADPREFVIVDWSQQDRVLLRAKDNTFWYMNPITGELTPRN